jgi:hypothetical protein
MAITKWRIYTILYQVKNGVIYLTYSVLAHTRAKIILKLPW